MKKINGSKLKLSRVAVESLSNAAGALYDAAGPAPWTDLREGHVGEDTRALGVLVADARATDIVRIQFCKDPQGSRQAQNTCGC